MLKNLAEFVELLQEKDRNQLQLKASAVMLFMPHRSISFGIFSSDMSNHFKMKKADVG